MKKQAIQNFKVLESTSTRLCVELTSSIRLCGQRHSDRRSGSSVWVTHIEKYGKWKVFDNPFCRNDYWFKKNGESSRQILFAVLSLQKDGHTRTTSLQLWIAFQPNQFQIIKTYYNGNNYNAIYQTKPYWQNHFTLWRMEWFTWFFQNRLHSKWWVLCSGFPWKG